MPEPGSVRFPSVQLVRKKIFISNKAHGWKWTLKYFAGSPLGWVVLWEIQTDAETTSTDAMELIAVKISEAYDDN